MITPSHLIYGWALAKYTEKAGLETSHRTTWFLVGSILPDMAVFVFFVVNGLILRYGHEQLWDDMYFNSAWSIAFTLSHSLLLWPALLAVGHWRQWAALSAVAIAALLHIIVDFCVHTADAYMHFWPLTDWRFISPVSYWNRAEYGLYVGLFDTVLVMGLLTFLYTRYLRQRYVQLILGILLALYLCRGVAELIF
jgi:hypothetical protein